MYKCYEYRLLLSFRTQYPSFRNLLVLPLVAPFPSFGHFVAFLLAFSQPLVVEMVLALVY